MLTANLENKTIAITGASSGFGHHFAGVLAGAGARVVLGARRVDKLEGRVAEIQASGGQAAAERGVIQIAAHKGFKPGTPLSRENVRHDVALVRLDSPIPSSELAPFAVHRGGVANGPVSVVSYGRGRSDALSRQNQCQVIDFTQQVLMMDCDVTFGSSGAPVFTHLNGRGRIVSVVSGMSQYQGRKVAFGMALDPVLAELKSNLRAGAPRPQAVVKRLVIGAGKTASGAKFVKP